MANLKDGRVQRTTYMPEPLRLYLKRLSASRFGNLETLYIVIISAFLEARPWHRDGLAFMMTKSTQANIGREKIDSGWRQVNMKLLPWQAEAVDHEADLNATSVASFLYTAAYWWGNLLYPPQSVIEERRSAGIPEKLPEREEIGVAVNKTLIEIKRNSAARKAVTKKVSSVEQPEIGQQELNISETQKIPAKKSAPKNTTKKENTENKKPAKLSSKAKPKSTQAKKSPAGGKKK